MHYMRFTVCSNLWRAIILANKLKPLITRQRWLPIYMDRFLEERQTKSWLTTTYDNLSTDVDRGEIHSPRLLLLAIGLHKTVRFTLPGITHLDFSVWARPAWRPVWYFVPAVWHISSRCSEVYVVLHLELGFHTLIADAFPVTLLRES